MSKVNFRERASALLRQEIQPSDAAQRIIERPSAETTLHGALERFLALLESVSPEAVAAELPTLAPTLDRIATLTHALAHTSRRDTRSVGRRDDEPWLD